MATAAQVKALIETHARGDDVRFYAIAMQVAAHAARQGHTRFARELRDLVDEAQARVRATEPGQQTRPVPIVQPRGELAGLLAAGYPTTALTQMALEPEVRARLDRVLLEQRQRERIREHGLHPIRKLLLVGPPGTGKTMTAAAMAGELRLPLFTIQLDGLITRYLGETVAKLRLIFDAIQQTRGVYLFDEFDALGGERGARNEVGEIRRVLNSFLQFLELDESDSLIVAATNHPQILDPALFRRFDAVIEHGPPSPEVLERVLRSRLALLGENDVDWSRVVEAGRGLSHADLVRACDHAVKDAILEDRPGVGTEEVIQSLNERRSADGLTRGGCEVPSGMSSASSATRICGGTESSTARSRIGAHEAAADAARPRRVSNPQ